jgi:hypothetical protein
VDITGIGEGLTAIKGLADKIWPDKTEVAKADICAFVAMVQQQTEIDKAEAQSTDPLQHWRGGLGWVCALTYFNNFILIPWATAFGLHAPMLDMSSLSTLTLGMLGLGGMHTYQTVKGA